jgi:hypothetical protein
MRKCIDKGAFTCIGRSGKPKRRFETSEHAISAAKLINDRHKELTTKLVGYKCSHCHGFHLTTHTKRVRNK